MSDVLKLGVLAATVAAASAAGAAAVLALSPQPFELRAARAASALRTTHAAVALTPQDAQRLGVDPAALRYGYRVVTAGGQIRAASVKLASITVAGARVDNVDALVIEKGLDTSLLGMTYLGRLSRFEAGRGGLVLQP